MKRLLIALIIFTTPFVSNAQLKKVALISVFGNRNLSNNILETSLYETLMKDSSFNLTKIVTKFDNIITTTLVPQFPFPFVPKEEVVNANGYKDLKELTKWAKDDWQTTPAEGYVPIAAFGIFDDEAAIKKSFDVIPDIDGVMIAYIEFQLYDAVGMGGITTKKVYAYVNIKIFDKDGDRIFKLKERSSSSGSVMAIGGFVTDVKKIMPLINDASDKLLVDMQQKLPKSLAKMAKKMEKEKEKGKE
jgi:hypothetical protein